MSAGRLDFEDYTLFYDIEDEFVTVTGLRGTPMKVEIPKRIEDKKVVRIGKKAFLSVRGLTEVVIPDHVKEIEEWAFAYTKTLKRVSLPSRKLSLGKDLFLGCEQLETITFRDSAKRTYAQDIGLLTAKAMILLDSPFLCNPLEAGSMDWNRQLDERIITFMEKDDMDGYAELWTCGEEDYEGKDYDAYTYPKEKRKEKVRMLFFRLIHADGLQEVYRQRYIEYLVAHTALCEEEETWEVLSEEFGNERAYYEMFANIGCLTEANFDVIMDRLRDIANRDVTRSYPEMKGYFIRFRQENASKEDFFDSFVL